MSASSASSCSSSATGRLLVNEIAPRVHNTGHWTQDGCVCDQFEQHIRAVAGWPLGPTDAHAQVEMTNLLGDEVDAVAKLAAEPDAAPAPLRQGRGPPGPQDGPREQGEAALASLSRRERA